MHLGLCTSALHPTPSTTNLHPNPNPIPTPGPQAVQRANATPYGLAAGVFNTSVATVNTLTRALKAGTVWVNCYGVFDR